MRKILLADDIPEQEGGKPHAVAVCLWRRCAERFNESLIGSRIILSGVRVNEFKGCTQLVSTNATYWEARGERASEDTIPKEFQIVASSDTYLIDAEKAQPLMFWENQRTNSSTPYVAKVIVAAFTVRTTNICPKCSGRAHETFGSRAKFWCGRCNAAVTVEL